MELIPVGKEDERIRREALNNDFKEDRIGLRSSEYQTGWKDGYERGYEKAFKQIEDQEED